MLKNSLCSEKNSLHVLVLGGKNDINQLVLKYEASKPDGHCLLFAACMESAWIMLATNQVDRIIVEAFMETSENESSFQFLSLLKKSAYSHIPVVLVAAEPSPIGVSLAPLVARAAQCLGVDFELVCNFLPEDARARTNKMR